jgi:uncharacterized protein YdaU (DUF1376 family)
MAEFAALPLFTDSWIADTAFLPRAHRGLYHDLLVLMWRSPECRVPNDMEWIAERLQCTEDEKLVLSKIVATFCSSTGNWLLQKRLQKEFQFVRASSKKQSVRAKSRWNKEKDISRGNASAHASGNAPSPSPSPSPSSSPNPFEDVDAALRAIPGISAHPVFADPVIAPIWKLVQDGYDLKTQVIPSIKAQIAKTPKSRSIQGWRYFVRGIVDSVHGSAPAPAAVPPDKWAKRLATARETQQWDAKWGALPNEPGCQVPIELVQPTDGKGWALWRPAA